MKNAASIGLFAAILFGTVAHAAEVPAPSVPYPAGYRVWPHVKSMLIYSDKHPLFASFGGLHHIYVNRTGLKASKAQGTYPEGTVLVFDLLQVQEDQGAYIEGPRKLVAVMLKNSKRFKTTGGWGFEAFKAGDPKQRVVTNPAGQCFGCHTSQKEHDYVFSTFRE